MAFINNFDARQVEPMGEYSPVPAGDYTAVISSSEEKPTKDNTGSYIEIWFEIIDGQQKGRKVVSRLNLNNKNQTAVDIAKRELSSICHAVNVLSPRDSSELHNLPMSIKVVVTPGTGNYGPGNEIKAYKAVGSVQQAQEVVKKPWEK